MCPHIFQVFNGSYLFRAFYKLATAGDILTGPPGPPFSTSASPTVSTNVDKEIGIPRNTLVSSMIYCNADAKPVFLQQFEKKLLSKVERVC